MSDLLLFLAAIETAHAPPPPPEPHLGQLVDYAVGSLTSRQREEIESFASDNAPLRLRLFNVWQSVQALSTGTATGLSPTEDPFLAEVASIWRRKTASAAPSPPPTLREIPVVGRDDDSARLLQILRNGANRLTTLIGPGGVGKTCLLRKMASDAETLFPDGTIFLECASLEHVEQFYSDLAAAAAIETEEEARREVFSSFENRRILLLLDRVDGLTHLVPEVRSLLERCPWLQVVATSRTPLGAEGENPYRVAPLGIADDGERVSDAVTLFTNMARRVLGDFRVTAARLKLIREVCRLAMGAPLALSIAAGCLSDQSLPNLVKDMRQPAAIRSEYANQPVYSSIAHAFNLISISDRDVLIRLGVFAGPFGFEDARYVSFTTDSSLSNALVRLQRYGLVESRVGPDGITYRLHDSVLEYLESLPSNLLLSRHRHTDLFARKAEAIGRLMSEGRWRSGTGELLRNCADLRRAIRHSIELNDRERIQQLADGLARTYFEAGYLSDFKAISDAAIQSGNTELTIRMLGLKGALASLQGEEPLCTELWQRRLNLARQTGDLPACADSLTDLAWQAFELGNLSLADQYLTESEAVAMDAGISELVATAQVIRARILMESGVPEEARVWVRKTLETLPRCTDKSQLPFIYQGLVTVYTDLGDEQTATELSLRLLSVASEGHRSIHVGRTLSRLAPLYENQGDLIKALFCYSSAVSVLNEYGTNDRRRIERELESFCDRNSEAIRGVLDQARETPWQTFVDSLLRQAQGSPSESTQ